MQLHLVPGRAWRPRRANHRPRRKAHRWQAYLTIQHHASAITAPQARIESYRNGLAVYTRQLVIKQGFRIL
jgi:hypothetical protein